MKKDRTPHQALPLFVAALLLTLFALSSCALGGLTDGWADGGEHTVNNSPTAESTSSATTTAATTTAAPVTTGASALYFNPLTGLPSDSATATGRPIALCVRRASRTTISGADIVIEGPTEASATRLMLLGTAHTSPLKKAELASVRPHLAMLANDFFAVSLFCGTNDSGLPSTDFLFDTADASSLQMSDEITPAELLRSLGIGTEIAGRIALPYQLAPVGESLVPEGTPSTYVSVPFSDTAATSFTYDTLTRCYTMRTSSALTDSEGALPAFANLLVLMHDATHHITKDGSELVIDTASGGTGYLVTAGRSIQILWQRDPATANLRITDKDGHEITLNRGKTYVAMTTYEHRERLILN